VPRCNTDATFAPKFSHTVHHRSYMQLSMLVLLVLIKSLYQLLQPSCPHSYRDYVHAMVRKMEAETELVCQVVSTLQLRASILLMKSDMPAICLNTASNSNGMVTILLRTTKKYTALFNLCNAHYQAVTVWGEIEMRNWQVPARQITILPTTLAPQHRWSVQQMEDVLYRQLPLLTARPGSCWGWSGE